MITTAAIGTRHTVLDSPLGPLTVVRDDEGIAGVYFPGHWTRPDRTTFGPPADPTPGGFRDVAGQLEEYFAGQRRRFDLPLTSAPDDTGRAVRQLLDAIPYGSTTTYGALARELDRGLTARDVGSLIGRNPLSILVPCHRVVAAGGELTGYAGGVQRKRYLLDLEQSTVDPAARLW